MDVEKKPPWHVQLCPSTAASMSVRLSAKPCLSALHTPPLLEQYVVHDWRDNARPHAVWGLIPVTQSVEEVEPAAAVVLVNGQKEQGAVPPAP